MPRKKKEQKKKNTVKKKDDKRVTKGRIKDKKEEESVLKEESARVVYAQEKYLRISARKARLVVDMIRGKPAWSVVSKLSFVRKKASLLVKKAVESAIANAVNNFEMDKKKLFIKEAFVNEAPTFKRGRAGSRGRYNPILKRNCHIIVGVCER